MEADRNETRWALWEFKKSATGGGRLRIFTCTNDHVIFRTRPQNSYHMVELSNFTSRGAAAVLPII